jgi:hypothetical protein
MSSIQWVNLIIKLNNQTIFTAIFTVSSNVITAIYQVVNGKINYTNILGPETLPPPDDYLTDNIFNTSTLSIGGNLNGFNITTSNLQASLSSSSAQFNIYSNASVPTLYQLSNDIANTTVSFTAASPPQSNMQFTMNINQNYIEYSNQTVLGVNYGNRKMPILPAFFNPVKSLFSNNSSVVYKEHSLSTGGGGTVKNSRAKSKRT